MESERLQEIQRQVQDTVSEDEQEDIWELANELITALKAAQAELAEANDRLYLPFSAESEKRTIADLRKQLAEAQAEIERLRKINLDAFVALDNADYDSGLKAAEILERENE